MTVQEIETLKETIGKPTQLWKEAFEIYNERNNPKLSMNCFPCWHKVLKYHMETMMPPQMSDIIPEL